MQRWKLRLWGCTLSLKCHMLRSEYQMLVFDACCWTPVALLHRLLLLLLILSSTRPLEDAAFPQRLRISCGTHFCQPSLLCKQALIFIVASSLLSTVPKHKVTRALGVVLQCDAYDCRATAGFIRIYESPRSSSCNPDAGSCCIKSYLLNIALDRPEVTVCATIAETWNWFSCLVKCVGVFAQAVVLPSTSLHTCTPAFWGDGEASEGSRRACCGLISISNHRSFIVRLLSDVHEGAAVSVMGSPLSLRIIKQPHQLIFQLLFSRRIYFSVNLKV